MPDYSKTFMYDLYSPRLGLHYYGHSTQTVAKRLCKHRSDNKTETKNGRCSSKIITDEDDHVMVWLEDWPCENIDQARARERWWIENNECINMDIPGRTKKEYYDTIYKEISNAKSRAYREENRERLTEHTKQWRKDNTDKMKAYSALPSTIEKRKGYEEARKQRRAFSKSMDGMNNILY